MNCPVCSGVRMREVEKNGVHIDTCPDCKGVWLDRGELDKLMTGIREINQDYNNRYRDDDDDDDDEDRDKNKRYAEKKDSYPSSSERYDSDNRNPKHKKKNSILDAFSDLF